MQYYALGPGRPRPCEQLPTLGPCVHARSSRSLRGVFAGDTLVIRIQPLLLHYHWLWIRILNLGCLFRGFAHVLHLLVHRYVGPPSIREIVH
jgi:hypothetical protein